jgi:polysaccharide biosynthesis PFTS motif protein
MNIPVISEYIKQRSRRKLYAMMRGYRLLKARNQLSCIMDTQIALVEMPLGISKSKISRHLFGAATDKANEAIRDFLVIRVGMYSLNKSLLISLGKKKDRIVHPLPEIWRGKIRSLGWRVSEIKSALMWQGFLSLCFGYGGFLLTKNLLLGIITSFRKIPDNPVRSVYFAGLTKNNLPQQEDGDSYNIISWYLQWQGRETEIQTIGHNVKSSPDLNFEGVNVRFVDPFAPVKGVAKTLRLFVWGCVSTVMCLFDMLRGHWWSPLMFGPCVQAFIAKHQPTFAIDYMFHNSNSRKPLWLHEVEANGAKSSFYFYSTNCDPFKTKEGYQSTPAYYRNMNWSRYLVWDQEQANFVRRCAGNLAKVEIVGPIWYSDTSDILPELTSRTVAVFDIQPKRKSVYEVLGSPLEYYTPAVGIKFLNDIHEAVVKYNWIMAWKGKRKLPLSQNRQIAKSYQSACEKLASSPSMLVIDPDVSAARLIEKSDLVISMPFTSTGLVAKNLGKPSYYYDPFGIIQKDDRAAHGIPIISGLDKLQEIFMANYQSFPTPQMESA